MSSKVCLKSVGLLAVIAPVAALADNNTVFSDTFNNGSTLNSTTATPTANSTSYQVVSSKNATGSSMAANDLKLTFPSTSSGIAEIQAQFTSSPVALVSVGDDITLNVSFVSTSGIFPAASIASGSSFLAGGLFNSGGTAPIASGALNNSGDSSGLSTFGTGGAQNWVGYVGRINGQNANSIIGTRPAQVSGNNTAQELIGTGFSAGGSYANGVTVHTKASSALQVSAGDLLNYSLNYTLTAAGTITITDTLVDQTTSTTLFTDSVAASGANYLAGPIDSLGFGYRSATNNAAALTMDITQISITDTVPTPEPSTLALAGVGALASLRLFRRNRK